MKKAIRCLPLILLGLAIGLALCGGVGSAIWLLLRSKGDRDIRRVNRPDPALQAAITKAKKDLPLFLHELDQPKDGERFAVMFRFSTPSGNEYLWVKDPKPEGSDLVGTLDQQPVSADLHKGDKVSLSTSDVVDWMIRDPNGKIRGQFTEAAR